MVRMLGRKSNKQIEEEKVAFATEMEFHARVWKEIMRREDELKADKDDVRGSMETTMRKYGFDKYPLTKVEERRLLLTVKLAQSKPIRKFNYDGLYEEDTNLYQSLVTRGFISTSTPKKPYRMTFRRLKATKEEVARGIHPEH